MTQYDLLFGDQKLKDILVESEFAQGSSLDVGRARMWEGDNAEAARLLQNADEPWASLILAQGQIGAGSDPSRPLRSIAEDAFQPSRPRLWAWHALREAGQKVAAVHAAEVLGVVVEVPMESGLDVLAVYADGSARFLGHADQLAIIEPAQGPSKEVAAALAEAHVLLQVPPAPRDPKAGPPQPGSVRLTALSARGLHRVEVPEAEVEPEGRFGALFAALTRVLAQVTEVK